MAEYLELAGMLIKKRESAELQDRTILELNALQCTRLWRHIKAIHKYFSWSLFYLQPTWIKYIPIFKEFYIILTRADIIKQQFSSVHSWLETAILQAHYKRAFRQLNLDLLSCMEVFYKFSNSLGDIPISAASRTIADQFIEMDVDYVEDVISFRKTLKELVTQSALCEEEKLLAKYLLERESLSTTDNEELPQFFIPKCGYPILGKHIGHGSSGAVYEVKWLGLTCAKKHYSATEQMQECMKEVNILAKLNNPHIVKLLCVSLKPEVSFVMEIMPMNLTDFIKTRWKNHTSMPFIMLAVIDIMLQIARGMEYLHEQGVAHRDLKSSNVLVAPSADVKLRNEGYADVKLTDFGLAKMKVEDLENPSRENTGTTKWRPPEAFAKDQLVDWKKADVYSFAMLCIKLLTGKPPFHSLKQGEVYAMVSRGKRPELPSSCPPDLASLLRDCWHMRPSARPSFTEIIKSLSCMKSGLPMGTRQARKPGLVSQLSVAGLQVARVFSGIRRLHLS